MRHNQHPSYRAFTGYDGIPAEVLGLFVNLTADLSPENISCDGELSRSQVTARFRNIKRKWKALETFVGRPVTEDEIWRHEQTRETELQAEYKKLVEVKPRADGDTQAQQNGTMAVTENVAYTIETEVKVSTHPAHGGPAAVEETLIAALGPLALMAGRHVTFSITAGQDKPTD